MTFDLIVVGAGPGGATTAAVAANAGLRVLLIERSTFPRDKICGDAISGKSVEILEKLALTRTVAAAQSVDSWGVLFSSPSGAAVEIPFSDPRSPDDPPGYICAREVFDELVARRAVDMGAELREGVSVDGLMMNNGQVAGVRLRGGEHVEAPLVVGADGAYSVVARELGFNQLDERHYYAGVRAYYRGVTDFLPRHIIELHFVDEAIPGYFWIFPMADGMANVGMGTLSSRIKKDGVKLKELLAATIESPRFRDRFAEAEPVGKVRGWGMPLGSAPRSMAGDGWMLVGDAASLIDPFTGEGIGNAMVSGDIAARWAVKAHEAGSFRSELLAGYQTDVHERLDSELRLSYTLRRLERWRWLLNAVIRKAGRNPHMANTISSMFSDLDAREKLASPLFYLRMLAS